MTTGTVEPLYDGDRRVDRLLEDLWSVIDRFRDHNMTAATVLGCVTCVQHRLLHEISADLAP